LISVQPVVCAQCSMSLSRPDVDQLLGYALLDYPDEYALHSVGHYLARYGMLIT